MKYSRRELLKFSVISLSSGIVGCSGESKPSMPGQGRRRATASAPPDRIVFPGNPWPLGHAIVAFRWSARIEPDSGLWFDLHLESADYDSEDGGGVTEERESSPNWESKIVWNNYNSCILSSTQWDDDGFIARPDGTPFDFDSLSGREFIVDPLPIEDDDRRAFGIYLQGHDSVAAHRIVFRQSDGGHRWSIEWSGKIALTYLGDDRFRYQFEARVSDASFGGIALPPGTSRDQAISLLDRFVAVPANFSLRERDDQLWFDLT